ncbi:MAG: hypothetical protein IKL89_00250 [Clostridia bacterium]|nr:hypothetical protein [Clostridia bacterium]
MRKNIPDFSSAMLSLRWATLLSLAFEGIGLLLGLVLAFSAGIASAGAILSFAMVAVSLVLTVLFVPPATRAAAAERQREQAVHSVFRHFFTLISGMLSAAVLTGALLLFPSMADYLALLPLLIAALALGIYIAAHKLRRRLYTTEERLAVAALPLPRSQNILAFVLIGCTNLALAAYRIAWVFSGFESALADVLCLIGFILLSLAGILLPLFRGDAKFSRRVRLLSLCRNVLFALGLIFTNLSLILMRTGDIRNFSVDFISLSVGLVLILLSVFGYRMAIRREAAKK